MLSGPTLCVCTFLGGKTRLDQRKIILFTSLKFKKVQTFTDAPEEHTMH